MFGKIQSTLLMVGGIIAAIFSVFLYGKKSGENDAEKKQNEDLLKKNKEANNLDNKLRSNKSFAYQLLHKNSRK